MPAVALGDGLWHAVEIEAVVQRCHVAQVVWRGPAQRGIEVALGRNVGHFHGWAGRGQDEGRGGIQRGATDDAVVVARRFIEVAQLISHYASGGDFIAVRTARTQRERGMLEREHVQPSRLLATCPRGQKQRVDLRGERDGVGDGGVAEQVVQHHRELRQILADFLRERQERVHHHGVARWLNHGDAREWRGRCGVAIFAINGDDTARKHGGCRGLPREPCVGVRAGGRGEACENQRVANARLCARDACEGEQRDDDELEDAVHFCDEVRISPSSRCCWCS